jgi:hypothetical protein
MIALSRDLEHGLGLRFGDVVCLEGLGTFRFEDRMAWYWARRIDLYLATHGEAQRFGQRPVALLPACEWLAAP